MSQFSSYKAVTFCNKRPLAKGGGARKKAPGDFIRESQIQIYLYVKFAPKGAYTKCKYLVH